MPPRGFAKPLRTFLWASGPAYRQRSARKKRCALDTIHQRSEHTMSQEYLGRNRTWELRSPPTTAHVLAEGDYAVEVSTSGLSGHFTKVKVTRLTDGRVIFPFDGSETL